MLGPTNTANGTARATRTPFFFVLAWTWTIDLRGDWDNGETNGQKVSPFACACTTLDKHSILILPDVSVFRAVEKQQKAVIGTEVGIVPYRRRSLIPSILYFEVPWMAVTDGNESRTHGSPNS